MLLQLGELALSLECLALNPNWWSRIRFIFLTIFISRRVYSFSNKLDITGRSDIGPSELDFQALYLVSVSSLSIALYK